MERTTRVLGPLLAALVMTLPAGAASKGITVTKNGFVPTDVSITTGDTVTWTNSDAVAHQVAFDKAACNLVVQPGQQGSCQFPEAGVFNYRDPSQRGSFRGSVRVQAASAGLSLASARQIVVYGSTVGLTGTLASQTAGQTITILAQPAGATAFAPVGSATTLAGGDYAYSVRPAIGTTYEARWSGGTSPSVKVEVRPRVALAVVSARLGKLVVRVAQRRAPVGKTVDLQRRNAYGQWVTVKRVALKSIGSKTTAAVTFTVRVPKGESRLRVLMTKTQAGAGYLLGRSPVRTIRR